MATMFIFCLHNYYNTAFRERSLEVAVMTVLISHTPCQQILESAWAKYIEILCEC